MNVLIKPDQRVHVNVVSQIYACLHVLHDLTHSHLMDLINHFCALLSHLQFSSMPRKQGHVRPIHKKVKWVLRKEEEVEEVDLVEAAADVSLLTRSWC